MTPFNVLKLHVHGGYCNSNTKKQIKNFKVGKERKSPIISPKHTHLHFDELLIYLNIKKNKIKHFFLITLVVQLHCSKDVKEKIKGESKMTHYTTA